jgi:hypothetical protein
MRETSTYDVRRPVSGSVSAGPVLGIEQQLEQCKASSSSSTNSSDTSAAAAAEEAPALRTAQLAAAAVTTATVTAAAQREAVMLDQQHQQQQQHRPGSDLAARHEAAAAAEAKARAQELSHTLRSQLCDPAVSREAFDATLLQAMTASVTAKVYEQASSELAQPQASDAPLMLLCC